MARGHVKGELNTNGPGLWQAGIKTTSTTDPLQTHTHIDTHTHRHTHTHTHHTHNTHNPHTTPQTNTHTHTRTPTRTLELMGSLCDLKDPLYCAQRDHFSGRVCVCVCVCVCAQL